MAISFNMTKNQFTITKKIAKHGKQAVIVIPAILSQKINAGMLVKVTIDVLDNENNILEAD